MNECRENKEDDRQRLVLGELFPEDQIRLKKMLTKLVDEGQTEEGFTLVKRYDERKNTTYCSNELNCLYLPVTEEERAEGCELGRWASDRYELLPVLDIIREGTPEEARQIMKIVKEIKQYINSPEYTAFCRELKRLNTEEHYTDHDAIQSGKMEHLANKVGELMRESGIDWCNKRENDKNEENRQFALYGATMALANDDPSFMGMVRDPLARGYTKSGGETWPVCYCEEAGEYRIQRIKEAPINFMELLEMMNGMEMPPEEEEEVEQSVKIGY